MNMICNMYLYICIYKYIYIYTGWIWSYHQPGFAPEAQWYRMPSYSLYLFTWNSSVKPMTVMMSAVNQKKTCFFIGVCSVKVFYTVSAKKNTHWCREGRKTLPSAIFVFKRSLRQVQETDRTGSMEATMTVYKLGQLGGEFPRKNYPPKVGVSMIKSLS